MEPLAFLILAATPTLRTKEEGQVSKKLIPVRPFRGVVRLGDVGQRVDPDSTAPDRGACDEK